MPQYGCFLIFLQIYLATVLACNHPDRTRVSFADHHLVSNGRLILPATLALRLGPPQLVQKHLDLGDAPGRTTPATI